MTAHHRPQKNYHEGDYRINDNQNNHRGKDNYGLYRDRDNRAPCPPSRGDYQGWVALVLTLDALTKPPKEILATETQLPKEAVRNDIGIWETEPYGESVRHRGRGINRESAPNTARSSNMKRTKGLKAHEGKRESRNPTEEPLIVEAEVEGYVIRKIYVDEGASMEVMFEHCFENLSLTIRARLKDTQNDLVGSPERGTTMKFTVIRAPSPHNVILGRPGLKALRAIPSTIHSMMKFPTPKGIETLVTRSVIISECRRLEKKQMIKEKTTEFEKKEDEGTEEVSMTKEVLVNPAFLDQLAIIEGRLSKEYKSQLKLLLKNNMEKQRVLALEKSRAVTKEVAKWVKAWIFRPVRYPTWISNTVLVKKDDGSWRMCMDFKNLNSSCPKDYYPLPNIDWTTYQRLVDSAFQCQTRSNLEAYVDDMVIKSNDEKMLLADIVEKFDNMRRIDMKLNPKKCSFGVEEGKFLGYRVTSEGIRANPKKI
ncbi:hypothetical protein Tco_0843694, partial [Tanacetum coccineum]